MVQSRVGKSGLSQARSGASEGLLGTLWLLYAQIVGILLHKPSARVAYTAQVSVASVGHLPHLVPHSPPIAEIAGRALTLGIPTWV